ncbi:MAG: hypothetical protein OHK0047_23030 [Leptolyngbyaceae cyanobacterium]
MAIATAQNQMAGIAFNRHERANPAPITPAATQNWCSVGTSTTLPLGDINTVPKTSNPALKHKSKSNGFEFNTG